MATFSTNQNRQLYVVKSVGTVSKDSEAGTIETGSIVSKTDKEIFFKYKGADTSMRSGLIPVKNITYIKAVKAEDMQEKLTKVTVTLDPDVNGGQPISGQDYILNIALRQFYGMSDEDQYFKFGTVHVTKNMDATKFFEKMAESLEKNFSREIGTYFKFTANGESLEIEEVEQPWTLGVLAQERVHFTVLPSTICDEGDEVIWGKVEVSQSDTVVKNGKKIADLEWFCMGERGDQYRMKGWPNIVPTTYLVDPSKEYNVLEIHYAFTDSGAESYRSERDITLVAENASDIDTIVGDLNAILSDTSNFTIDTLGGGSGSGTGE